MGWEGRETVALDPPRLTMLPERGPATERRFDSEDALCRFLLVRALTRQGAPIRWNGTAPAPRPGGAIEPTPAPGADAAPADRRPQQRWSWPVAPLTAIAARGEGLVVLRDTASLDAHGAAGAPWLTALDVATGRERWALPLPAAEVPVIAVAGTVAGTVVRERDVTSQLTLVGDDGRARWTRPAAELVTRRGDVLYVRRGDGLSGLDRATGRTLWTTGSARPATLTRAMRRLRGAAARGLPAGPADVAPRPAGTGGVREDDGHAVAVRDGLLLAWRC